MNPSSNTRSEHSGTALPAVTMFRSSVRLGPAVNGRRRPLTPSFDVEPRADAVGHTTSLAFAQGTDAVPCGADRSQDSGGASSTGRISPPGPSRSLRGQHDADEAICPPIGGDDQCNRLCRAYGDFLRAHVQSPTAPRPAFGVAMGPSRSPDGALGSLDLGETRWPVPLERVMFPMAAIDPAAPLRFVDSARSHPFSPVPADGDLDDVHHPPDPAAATAPWLDDELAYGDSPTTPGAPSRGGVEALATDSASSKRNAVYVRTWYGTMVPLADVAAADSPALEGEAALEAAAFGGAGAAAAASAAPAAAPTPPYDALADGLPPQLPHHAAADLRQRFPHAPMDFLASVVSTWQYRHNPYSCVQTRVEGEVLYPRDSDVPLRMMRLAYRQSENENILYGGRCHHIFDQDSSIVCLKLGGVCVAIGARSIAQLIADCARVTVLGVDMFTEKCGRCCIWVRAVDVARLMAAIEQQVWMGPEFALVALTPETSTYLAEKLRRWAPKCALPFPRHLMTVARWVHLRLLRQLDHQLSQDRLHAPPPHEAVAEEDHGAPCRSAIAPAPL